MHGLRANFASHSLRLLSSKGWSIPVIWSKQKKKIYLKIYWYFHTSTIFIWTVMVFKEMQHSDQCRKQIWPGTINLVPSFITTGPPTTHQCLHQELVTPFGSATTQTWQSFKKPHAGRKNYCNNNKKKSIQTICTRETAPRQSVWLDIIHTELECCNITWVGKTRDVPLISHKGQDLSPQRLRGRSTRKSNSICQLFKRHIGINN